MATNAANTDLSIPEQMHEKGLSPVGGPENVVHRGRLYSAEHYKKDDPYSTGGKVLLAGVTAIMTVAGLGIPLAFPEFRKNTTAHIFGKDEETVYFEVDQAVQDSKDPKVNPLYDKRFDIRDVDALDAKGNKTFLYDPNVPSTVVDYINRPEVHRELRQGKGGNLYLIEKRRPGVSSFIFVPKGDYSKAVSVLLWNCETGGKLTNEDQIDQTAQSYCASSEHIEKEWEKGVEEKLVPSFIKLRNKGKSDEELEVLLKDPQEIEVCKKIIMSRRRTTVLDLANHRARIYAKVDPNVTKTSDYETGFSISFDEDLTKEINKIHGLTGKEDLKGERPFREPLPKDDGDYSSDSDDMFGGPQNRRGPSRADLESFQNMMNSWGQSQQPRHTQNPQVQEMDD